MPSCFCKGYKKITGIIPVKEKFGFIHNTVFSIKGRVEDVSLDLSSFLQISVKKLEKHHSLLIDLYGTMDKRAAERLKKRLIDAIERIGLDISVNFENLKKATPLALHTLLSNVPKEIKPFNISPVFQDALKGIPKGKT